MNKILGVIGSPRKKGNTHILVTRILEGAKAEGADTEILFLSDLDIQECDGCHSCWKGRQCSKKDDNIKTADLLIRFFVKSLRYLEMKIIGKILSPGVSARGDILKKEEFLKKGYQLGKRTSKLRR